MIDKQEILNKALNVEDQKWLKKIEQQKHIRIQGLGAQIVNSRRKNIVCHNCIYQGEPLKSEETRGSGFSTYTFTAETPVCNMPNNIHIVRWPYEKCQDKLEKPKKNYRYVLQENRCRRQLTVVVICESQKFILDATAGYRMMWINKNHPNTIYVDKRTDGEILTDYLNHNLTRKIPRPCKNAQRYNNTITGDFKNLPYSSESFRLIVWDPPYYTSKSKNNWMYAFYGALQPETWQSDLKKGSAELFRLLAPYGILIFKWNNKQFKAKDVLKLFPCMPLFGQRMNNVGATKKTKRHSTFWFCFMKIPQTSFDAKNNSEVRQ